ncbi:hypothetical protein GWK47_048536 [Chionoecetes opilio]|uniref:Uncharacterized protein n=1 Tax=Chionoecetes opilio TaxID=41210 RepID=A0A8J4Y3U6_CHIOP|nr:hypothetical protein GWK47_048536 [Chionoecetes opilio]
MAYLTHSAQSRSPSPAHSISPDLPFAQAHLLKPQDYGGLSDTSEDETELRNLSNSSAEASPCVSPAPPRIINYVPKKVEFVQASVHGADEGPLQQRQEAEGSAQGPAIMIYDPDHTETYCTPLLISDVITASAMWWSRGACVHITPAGSDVTVTYCESVDKMHVHYVQQKRKV